MWWKDMKMRMCLVGGIVILLVIIIVPVVITYVLDLQRYLAYTNVILQQSKVIPVGDDWRMLGNFMDYGLVYWMGK